LTLRSWSGWKRPQEDNKKTRIIPRHLPAAWRQRRGAQQNSWGRVTIAQGGVCHIQAVCCPMKTEKPAKAKLKQPNLTMMTAGYVLEWYEYF
ncbi:hypothetical protein cypCar_00044918, partial [Cyprinus carpio]